MILFWLICAAFVAIALAFVVPPLLASVREDSGDENDEANVQVYRDQISELETDLQNGIISDEQYQQDRDEIERRLLTDVTAVSKEQPKQIAAGPTGRGLVYAVALALPVVALVFYLRIGTPAAITGVTVSPVRPPATNPRQNAPRSQADIEGNVAALAKRLEQNPGDAAGWTMLGRSYLSLGKYNEAANAYEKAAALKPNDADALADYAFAMGMANEKSLLGRPTELIKRVLELDPENPKGLQLAGSAAYEAKNYKDAIVYWQRLLAKTPKDSELAKELTERIEQAKAGVR